MRVTGAAAALRSAGLRVVELAGWRGRDNGYELASVRGLTVHHTAGSMTSSVEGELGVLVNGRPGLPGPISQFMVGRDGTWYCVAAGAANHNKIGTGGPNAGLGNRNLLGVECQHHGSPEPWSGLQYEAVVTGVAALAVAYGFPAGRVAGHKEHQPGEKVDPSFPMGPFRARVADVMEDLPVALTDDDKAWLRNAIREAATAAAATAVADRVDDIARGVWAHRLDDPFTPGDNTKPAGDFQRFTDIKHRDTRAVTERIAVELKSELQAASTTTNTLIGEVLDRLPAEEEPPPPAG